MFTIEVYWKIMNSCYAIIAFYEKFFVAPHPIKIINYKTDKNNITRILIDRAC